MVVVVVATRAIVLVGVVDGVQMKTFPIIAVSRAETATAATETERESDYQDKKKTKRKKKKNRRRRKTTK